MAPHCHAAHQACSGMLPALHTLHGVIKTWRFGCQPHATAPRATFPYHRAPHPHHYVTPATTTPVPRLPAATFRTAPHTYATLCPHLYLPPTCRTLARSWQRAHAARDTVRALLALGDGAEHACLPSFRLLLPGQMGGAHTSTQHLALGTMHALHRNLQLFLPTARCGASDGQ